MSKSKIRDLVLRHAPEHGFADTSIEGLQVIRVTEPVPTVPSIYPASVCFLVDGQKRVYFGGEAKTYGDGTFICCTMPLPVEAEVPKASPTDPVLGLLVSLETRAMTETLVATEATARLEQDVPQSSPGLVVADWDAPLVDAVWRLLELLDDEGAREVLVGARLREFYFALLRSRGALPFGVRLARRAISAARSRSYTSTSPSP